MKNTFLRSTAGLAAVILAGAIAFVSCEGPTGAAGGSGSSAPIIVTGGPVDTDFVQSLLDAQLGNLPEASVAAINAAGLLTNEGTAFAVTADAPISNEIWFVGATLASDGGTLTMRDGNTINIVGDGGLVLGTQILILAGGAISGGKIDGGSATVIARDTVYAGLVTGVTVTVAEPVTTSDGSLPAGSVNGAVATLLGNITIKTTCTNPSEISVDALSDAEVTTLYVLGNLTVADAVSVADVIVTGNSVALNAKLTGALEADAATVTISAENTGLAGLSAKSLTSSTGAITVGTAPINIKGSVNIGAQTFTTTTGATLEIGGTATFGGIVLLGANSTFHGVTTVAGTFTSDATTLTFNKNASFANTFTSASDVVTFNGAVSFSNAATRTTAGDWTFNGNVTLVSPTTSKIGLSSTGDLILGAGASIIVPGTDANTFVTAVTASTAEPVVLTPGSGAKLEAGLGKLSLTTENFEIASGNLIVNNILSVGTKGLNVTSALTVAVGGIVEVTGGLSTSLLKIEDGGTLALTPSTNDGGLTSGAIILYRSSVSGGSLLLGDLPDENSVQLSAATEATPGAHVILALRPNRVNAAYGEGGDIGAPDTLYANFKLASAASSDGTDVFLGVSNVLSTSGLVTTLTAGVEGGDVAASAVAANIGSWISINSADGVFTVSST